MKLAISACCLFVLVTIMSVNLHAQFGCDSCSGSTSCADCDSGRPSGKPNPFEQVIPEPGGGGGSECVTLTTTDYNKVRNCVEDCSFCTFEGCCTANNGRFMP